MYSGSLAPVNYDLLDAPKTPGVVVSEPFSFIIDPTEGHSSNTLDSFTGVSLPDSLIEASIHSVKYSSETCSPTSDLVIEEVSKEITLAYPSQHSLRECISSPSSEIVLDQEVSPAFRISTVTPNSSLPSSNENCFTKHSVDFSSSNTSAPRTAETSSTCAVCRDEVSGEVEVTQLQNQLTSMSQRLIATQNQVDRLLEEKRNWLESSQSNKWVPIQLTNGELRGRLIQAKAMAENYKQEKETMVVKYAQSEQKRMLLEQRLRALQLHVDQMSKGSIPDASKPLQPVTAELRELQQKLLQAEKDLVIARDQIESLKKSNDANEARVRALEEQLFQAQDNLRVEQKKLTTQNDAIIRLNRSLETVAKQAKEVERLREREARRLCMEVAYQESQDQLKQLQTEYAQLNEQIHLLEGLKLEVAEKDQRLSELKCLQAELSALRAELDASKQREHELSEFTRRLTEQNANLQAENILSLSRLNETELLLNSRKQQMIEAISQTDVTGFDYQLHKEQLEQQLSYLRCELTRVCQSEAELRSLLASEREQANVRRRRDLGRIRDVARQLALSYQRDTHTIGFSTCASVVDSPSIHEPCSGPFSGLVPSTVSSKISSSPTKSEQIVILDNGLVTTDVPRSPSPPSVSSVDPMDNQGINSEHSACITKILRLQQNQLDLTEELEFLQEHCRRLTEEICKKSRII